MVPDCSLDVSSHTFFNATDFGLNYVQLILELGFSVQFYIGLVYFHVKLGEFMLNLLHISLSQLQLIVHIQQHVCYYSSHFVLDFELLLVRLYCTQVSKVMLEWDVQFLWWRYQSTEWR